MSDDLPNTDALGAYIIPKRPLVGPTTAETPTMRDRPIDTMLANQGYAWFGRERAAKLVDAVLAEQIAFHAEPKD